MSLFKMWPIQPDDGRHDEEKEYKYSGNEWCEGCKQELPPGSTEFCQMEKSLWLCKTCQVRLNVERK